MKDEFRIRFEWEEIARNKMAVHGSSTTRVKVIGGWIVNSYTWVKDSGISESSIFVPDAHHRWEIIKD